ncbi:MAG: cytochrome c oxidase subunit 4 [Actinobacteria bacterium]|nr:cytochrome c oxidase subunit 4 [Actinomycetota bacterium]
MSLFSRITLSLGAFLIAAGVVYAVITHEWQGVTLIFTVAGGALLVGAYLVQAVQRARTWLAAEPAHSGAGIEPHVAPTIWPLIFALSMIGLVIGAVESRWALAGGGVLLVVALAGWSLDVRRQWRHADHAAGAGPAHGEAHPGGER